MVKFIGSIENYLKGQCFEYVVGYFCCDCALLNGYVNRHNLPLLRHAVSGCGSWVNFAIKFVSHKPKGVTSINRVTIYWTAVLDKVGWWYKKLVIRVEFGSWLWKIPDLASCANLCNVSTSRPSVCHWMYFWIYLHAFAEEHQCRGLYPEWNRQLCDYTVIFQCCRQNRKWCPQKCKCETFFLLNNRYQLKSFM